MRGMGASSMWPVTSLAERRVNYVRVHQIHGLEHVGLLPTPTLLQIDDDDGRIDHFDSTG
jgi:hypothetical protein